MFEEFEDKPKPPFWWSLLSMKCPRCRRGEMFHHHNPYKNLTLKHIFDMPERCKECRQKFEVETGFWYGTGYMSYALAVTVTLITFVFWWIFIGITVDDNRIFYWLGCNAVLLVILQPWLMRLSRVAYIYLFIGYDKAYKFTSPKEFD